ncbi:hypothetical protein N7456_013345 [Penicillium angulare]|uniref:Uncharacterized protein n=1 Tax=Penicillium angulare TaxID=116970 RepID=A0A9W9JTV4_9EURO|nr:hypothetical protein N7456_013345 [Penicillium angulare]
MVDMAEFSVQSHRKPPEQREAVRQSPNGTHRQQQYSGQPPSNPADGKADQAGVGGSRPLKL